MTPWTVARQAPLTMGIQARTLEWVAFSSRSLLGPGIQPTSPASAGGFFTTEPPGKPAERATLAIFTHGWEMPSGLPASASQLPDAL